MILRAPEMQKNEDNGKRSWRIFVVMPANKNINGYLVFLERQILLIFSIIMQYFVVAHDTVDIVALG